MKILFDLVYTQTPSRCSTSYLVWTTIESLLPEKDLFFYVVVPKTGLEPEDHEYVNRFADRVTLIPVDQMPYDRLQGLYMLDRQLSRTLLPWNPSTWDIDVVVSSRIPMLRFMRVHSARPLGPDMPSYRLYIGLEEMPVLPFRETVPWRNEMYPDTVMGYAMADYVLIQNLWTRSRIKGVLREVLSPSYQKQVLDKLLEVVPVKLEPLNIRKPERMYTGGPFRLTFTGRATAMSNFDTVCDLFRKAFSFPLGKNKQELVFTGASQGQVALKETFGDTSFWEIQSLPRAEFYQLLEDTHCLYIPSPAEDFSMSVYEALSRGVPIILHDKPWTEFLGPDYPFRVNSVTEALAMVNMLAADYAQEYKKFSDWHSKYWVPFTQSAANVCTSEVLLAKIREFQTRRAGLVAELGTSIENSVAEFTADSDSKVLDLGKHLKEAGTLHTSDSLLSRHPVALTYKLKAIEAGWADTNVCGIMNRA